MSTTLSDNMIILVPIITLFIDIWNVDVCDREAVQSCPALYVYLTEEHLFLIKWGIVL